MDELVKLLREFGFPTFFCVWLMWRVERELRDMKALMYKQVTLNAVIARTLDVPETTSIPPTSDGGG